MSTPDFQIDFLNQQFALRDIGGLLNDRVKALQVTGEHPLVMLTGSMFNAATNTSSKPDIAGLLPAVAVVEGDENEEGTTLGGGYRGDYAFTLDMVQAIRSGNKDLLARSKEGLITDEQLTRMELALRDQAATLKIDVSRAAITARVEGWWQREDFLVSVWGASLQERQIIGRATRSAVYRMRRAMRERHVNDISIRTTRGLVNFNYGRILYGQEFHISCRNHFWNVTVTDQKPLDKNLPVITQLYLRPPSDPVGVTNANKDGVFEPWTDPSIQAPPDDFGEGAG